MQGKCKFCVFSASFRALSEECAMMIGWCVENKCLQKGGLGGNKVGGGMYRVRSPRVCSLCCFGALGFEPKLLNEAFADFWGGGRGDITIVKGSRKGKRLILYAFSFQGLNLNQGSGFVRQKPIFHTNVQVRGL